MAHFQGEGPTVAAREFEDLHSVPSIFEPPPPKVEEVQPREAEVVPFTGLEIGSSGSAVKISVVPPDLARIIRTTEIPPRASIQVSQLYTDMKPRTGVSAGAERVYKPSEVDKAPVAVVKVIARVSKRVREDADQLRTTLELVVDAKGEVVTIRVLRSSGNAEFDTIVSQCVQRDWVFSPAIKNGRNVKCLVDQLVWYKWTTGSPFKI
jgi:TonB family protein